MPPVHRFKTPKQMAAKAEEYFESVDRITMTGLCQHLGIAKQTLSDYAKLPGFDDVVLMARQRVEAKVEELLLYDKAGAGAIFWLKNHAGYTDKTEQDVNVKGEFIVSDEPTIDEFDAAFAVGAPVRTADGAD